MGQGPDWTIRAVSAQEVLPEGLSLAEAEEALKQFRLASPAWKAESRDLRDVLRQLVLSDNRSELLEQAGGPQEALRLFLDHYEAKGLDGKRLPRAMEKKCAELNGQADLVFGSGVAAGHATIIQCLEAPGPRHVHEAAWWSLELQALMLNQSDKLRSFTLSLWYIDLAACLVMEYSKELSVRHIRAVKKTLLEAVLPPVTQRGPAPQAQPSPPEAVLAEAKAKAKDEAGPAGKAKAPKGPTLSELKELLKARGLPVSGKKAELLLRLEQSEGQASKPKNEAFAAKASMRELKELLQVRGLPVRGKKAELVLRLEKSEAQAARPKPEESLDLVATKGITYVRTVEEADKVMAQLQRLTGPSDFHALDTETRGWAPKMSRYSHGEIICMSIYCGDGHDFGSGPRIFVDNLGPDGKLRGLVEYMKPYLEGKQTKKVFHNYSFDYAMFINAGVRIGGFCADTMHMARLENANHVHYSLEFLGGELLGDEWRKTSFRQVLATATGKGLDHCNTEGIHLSADPTVRELWEDYSTFDTVATWKLHECLRGRLAATSRQDAAAGRTDLLEYYETYMSPFAEVLVSLEERGMPIDVEAIQAKAEVARADLEVAQEKFFKWLESCYQERYAEEFGPELARSARSFNAGSYTQMQHLLYGDGVRTIGSIKVGGLGLEPPSKPSADAATLKKLVAGAGSQDLSGLKHRIQASHIQHTLSSFLDTLPDWVGEDGRIHSSLNLNTATGRLSCREPNLQQLPAIEQDAYKIRSAVAPLEGKCFIISDYGQLDLRVLAHVSNCHKMIEALSSGVDLHSKTAYYMYPQVQEKVDAGKVVLEEDGTGRPIVKDVFPAERRNAKSVNFGIAYGLTEFGLSEQLNINKAEAADMISKWYEAYPEVKSWKNSVLQELATLHPGIAFVSTLRGRRRQLPGLNFPEAGQKPLRYCQKSEEQLRKDRVHRSASRKATNTPVQGGSADVVMEAMLKASRDAELEALGFKIVLQIHDELIFEGPEENAEAALRRVQDIMEHPFLDDFQLQVPLPVSIKVAKAWEH